MRVASFAVELLVFAIVAHWLIWRIRLPAHQTRALLVWLLGGAPICFVAGLYAVTGTSVWPRSIAEVFQVALFHLSMSLSYIVTYSALEEESPTLAIVKYVAAARTTGRSREDLSQIINDDTVVGSRIAAAVRDGLVSERERALELTDKGRRVARMFGLYRGVLGTEKGR